jgi:ion channel
LDRSQQYSLRADSQQNSFQSWQDRFRDPALSTLLAFEVCLIFLAAPLAAKGVPIAKPMVQAMVLAVVLIVGTLSQRRGALAVILVGLAAFLASTLLGAGWPPVAVSVLRRGGDILTFSALSWVVAHAVYAPGRITFHRLQGAVVLYLNFATIFAAAFSLIWELSPAAFTSILPATNDMGEFATMLYFSFTTLTTTGYGDIVPVDPFARSLANLEAVVGPFFLAITVARLVTLEVEGRRR